MGDLGRMPSLRRHKKIKQVGSELDIFLTTGVEMFDSFNEKKKKNDSEQSHEEEKLDGTRRKPVDFQPDMEGKIDALIADLEKGTKPEGIESVSQEKSENNLKKITDTKEPVKIKVEKFHFETEVKPEGTFNDFDSKDELFEIKPPSEIQPSSKIAKSHEEPKKNVLNLKIIPHEHTKNKRFLDQISGTYGKITKHSIIHSPHHIKIRSKEEREKLKKANDKNKLEKKTISFKNLKFNVGKGETGKNNVFTKTEGEFEKSGKEIEKKGPVEHNSDKLRKLELKKAKKESREKEKELEIKRLEAEKRKKLEFKKARKTSRVKDKELRESKLEEQTTEGKSNNPFTKKWRDLLTKKRKNLTLPNQQNISTSEVLKQENKQDSEKIKSLVPKMDSFIVGEKEASDENPILDEDIKRVLSIIDDLLGNLPEDVIDDFVKSEDFALYEKVVGKYKTK